MKTVWGISMIIAFATLLFVGVSNVNNQALIVNPNLDAQSIALIANYDTQIGNISDFATERPSTELSSNSTNQVDAFFREIAEAKNNYDKFTTGISFIYNIPETLLISIPFIDADDTSLDIFKGVFWTMIVFVIIIVGTKFIRGGKVDNEN